MMKIRTILVLLFCSLSYAHSIAQNESKYRITLTDKLETKYDLEEPTQFLSIKSVERRKRQSLPIDSTDLPVCESYLKKIKALGAKIVLTGKWDNFVTISSADSTLISEISKLPFVRNIRKVWRKLPSDSDTNGHRAVLDYESREAVNKKKPSIFGFTHHYLAMCGGDSLQLNGFTGKGMTIAVIDAGFQNVDSISEFQNSKIIGTRDFISPKSDIFAQSNHGTKVFGCLAMNQPNLYMGSAPEAEYWLLRSEDDFTEQIIEEDYFCRALEFADSVGVDIVNASIGYHDFDFADDNYKLRHLNGRDALISRQASKAAAKGILLVASAGNSGNKTWKKITPPADATDIITVGAVDKDCVIAEFSSVGNTSDSRIKPDIVACGKMVKVMNAEGYISNANGTSFSTPFMCGMIACLWQSLPELSVSDLIKLIRRSGDRFHYPDNIYGYGLPNIWSIYLENKKAPNNQD